MKFRNPGALAAITLTASLAMSCGLADGLDPFKLSGEIGAYGTGAGQFGTVRDFAIASDGSVAVLQCVLVDPNSSHGSLYIHKVQTFGADGTLNGGFDPAFASDTYTTFIFEGACLAYDPDDVLYMIEPLPESEESPYDGSFQLDRMNADGSVASSFPLSPHAETYRCFLDIPESGSFYLMSSAATNSIETGACLQRYGADGALAWTRDLPGEYTFVYATDSDSKGAFYYMTTGEEVGKIDADGDTDQTDHFRYKLDLSEGLAAALEDNRAGIEIREIAVDSSDSVWVLLNAYYDENGSDDWAEQHLVKLDRDLKIVKDYTDPEGFKDYYRMRADSKGNIYLARRDGPIYRFDVTF